MKQSALTEPGESVEAEAGIQALDNDKWKLRSIKAAEGDAAGGRGSTSGGSNLLDFYLQKQQDGRDLYVTARFLSTTVLSQGASSTKARRVAARRRGSYMLQPRMTRMGWHTGRAYKQPKPGGY